MPLTIGDRLGGTDGHRGFATDNPEPGLINEYTFAHLTYALVGMRREAGDIGPVVIAQDTRPSGFRFRMAAIAGALMCGAEVVDLGIAPTPAAQKVAERLHAAATVVVTASHNAVWDNGWKGMVGFGKPDDKAIAGYSSRFWDQHSSGLVIPSSLAEGTPQRPELVEEYENSVVAMIETTFGERPLKNKLFVVDGANGAAMKLTPSILKRLGARVERFACDPNGVINQDCGANKLDGLIAFLKSRPDITSDPDFVGALANDGDADRMQGVGVVWKNNKPTFVVINGNHVMGAMAEGQPGIVGTNYTNSGLRDHLRKENIGLEECENGDKYVTRKLLEMQEAGKNWQRGGEFTGHYVDLAWLVSGDGPMSAAWFAAHVVRKDMTFGDVYTSLPLWNESMLAVELPVGVDAKLLLASDVVQGVIARMSAKENRRILVRGSGTEPVIRIWTESPVSRIAPLTTNRIGRAVRAQLTLAA